MENGKYLNELNVAVRVVHMACSLCEKVQKELLSNNSDQVKSKDDDSLVTVAGNSNFFVVSFPPLFLGLRCRIYIYGVIWWSLFCDLDLPNSWFFLAMFDIGKPSLHLLRFWRFLVGQMNKKRIQREGFNFLVCYFSLMFLCFSYQWLLCIY